jgi:hypothetical protein
MNLSRFKSLLRAAINKLKDSTAFNKRARTERAAAERLQWALSRTEPDPYAPVATPKDQN